MINEPIRTDFVEITLIKLLSKVYVLFNYCAIKYRLKLYATLFIYIKSCTAFFVNKMIKHFSEKKTLAESIEIPTCINIYCNNKIFKILAKKFILI